MNAWGAYMISAVALLLILSPALASTSLAAREGADIRNVAGVGAILSSVRPGVTALFSFGESAYGDPISANGHTLSCSYGSGTVQLLTTADVSGVTLSPAVQYRAYVDGGVVVVVRAV